jgi:hypothetical protein
MVLLTKNTNRMRSLKFRMWDNVLKVMYTPELDAEITNLWETPNFKGGVFEPREGIKIMQFTGKYDCKGTPIYEGDIIEFDRKEWGGDDNIFTVEWDEDNAEWSWGGGCIGDMDWRTVIGNIWQHDYLLPQK